jgi:hypothetical protein
MFLLCSHKSTATQADAEADMTACIVGSVNDTDAAPLGLSEDVFGAQRRTLGET